MINYIVKTINECLSQYSFFGIKIMHLTINKTFTQILIFRY